MSASLLAVALAPVAAWLLIDSPAAQRRRLGPRPGPGDGGRSPNRQRLALAGGAGIAAASLGLLLGGRGWLILVLPCVVGGYWASGRLETRTQRQRRTAALEALPVALELLAVCLEAGAPLRGAVHRVAALGPLAAVEALSRIDATVGLGVDESTAWEQLAGDPVWGPVARDVVRGLATGTPTRDVLLQHAREGRRSAQTARLARARSVGVRSTLPLMTCFLPAFLLLGVVPVVASLVPQFL